MAGARARGRAMRKNRLKVPAPSTRAASSISLGKERKNWRKM